MAGEAGKPLALVVGTPAKNDEGQLTGVAEVLHVFDILGALVRNPPRVGTFPIFYL